jgi:hypothetical protein
MDDVDCWMWKCILMLVIGVEVMAVSAFVPNIMLRVIILGVGVGCIVLLENELFYTIGEARS